MAREYIYYHGTPHVFDAFEHRPGWFTTTLTEPTQVQRHGFFFSDHPDDAASYAGPGGKVISVKLSHENPIDLNPPPGSNLYEALWREFGDVVDEHFRQHGVDTNKLRYIKPWMAFDGELGQKFVAALRAAGYDGAYFQEETDLPDDIATTHVVFDPKHIQVMEEHPVGDREKGARSRARRNPLHPRHIEPLRDKTELPYTAHDPGRGVRHVRNLAAQYVDYVGCVVNPRNMRPYFVARVGGEDSFNFVLFVPSTQDHDVEVVGKLYFEEESGNDYAAPAHVNNMPRIHTPWGVTEEGSGLGTALYTGGALAGTYLSVGYEEGDFVALDFPGVGGHGCCSGEGANPSAERWWRNATLMGLAEHGEDSSQVREDSEDFSTDTYASVPLSSIVDWKGRRYKREAFSDIIDEAAYEAAHERAAELFEMVSNVDVDTWYIEDSSFTLNLYGTARVTWTDEDGEEHEDEHEVELLSVSVDELDADEWEEELRSFFQDGEPYEDLLRRSGISIADEVDVDVDVELTRATTTYNDDYLDVSVTVRATAEGQREVEGGETFVYPFRNAVRKSLVLDVTPALVETYEGYEPYNANERMLDVVLNLNLGEVEDPAAVAFFFALANHLGATYSQIRSFVNSVLAFRGDLDASLADLAVERSLEGERAWWIDALSEGGFRVNPPEEKDYAEIGRRLFGDIADLD